MSRINLNDCFKQMREEAEATKPQEHKPLGPATAEDQAIYNSIVSNYFESGALDWMQNIDAAMKEPSFQEARALMGTENYGQDVALLQALRCLRSRMSNVTKPQDPVAWNLFPGWLIDHHEGDIISEEGLQFALAGMLKEHPVTTPQPCPKCAEGMVSVTKEDANNYCRILTLLGMEEESPVEGVERLISLRDGMTCGDCNDTGWLENREEGRYPCTCMTEAEPYQILQAKCAELEDFCISQGNELAKLDEKVFDQDRLLKQQAEKISATLVALAGLPDGALDGGWTYACMNKYTLGLEADRDALKAENIALIGSGLKNEAERGSDCFLMTKIADLVQERDALAMQNQQMRSALLKLATLGNGDQYGNSIGNCIAQEALSLPDLSTSIIKRHDAAVIRGVMADIQDGSFLHDQAPPKLFANEVCKMLERKASKLEKS